MSAQYFKEVLTRRRQEINQNMGLKGALRLVHSKILVAYLKNHI